jgi:hypothetical protein
MIMEVLWEKRKWCFWAVVDDSKRVRTAPVGSRSPRSRCAKVEGSMPRRLADSFWDRPRLVRCRSTALHPSATSG